MNRIDHRDFFDIDLPRLEAEFGDEEKFVEFLASLDKAVQEIMNAPADEGAPLTRSPLGSTYRKKKFHFMLRSPQGIKTDMRLVYRWDINTNTLHVLGVGKRRPYQSNDIYEILNPRSPI